MNHSLRMLTAERKVDDLIAAAQGDAALADTTAVLATRVGGMTHAIGIGAQLLMVFGSSMSGG